MGGISKLSFSVRFNSRVANLRQNTILCRWQLTKVLIACDKQTPIRDYEPKLRGSSRIYVEVPNSRDSAKNHSHWQRLLFRFLKKLFECFSYYLTNTRDRYKRQNRELPAKWHHVMSRHGEWLLVGTYNHVT